MTKADEKAAPSSPKKGAPAATAAVDSKKLATPSSSSAPAPASQQPEKPYQVWDSRSNSWVARKPTDRDDEFNSRRTKVSTRVDPAYVSMVRLLGSPP